MRYKYFSECKTLEEGKRLYKTLAKRYHPDCGGDAEILKEINTEFERFFEEFKNTHENAEGKAYQSQKQNTGTAKEYMDIISKLFVIPHIEIEICGYWLWLSGNTYPYKDYLKEIGCRWSVGKKKWYYTTDPYIRKKSTMSMTDIRNAYGSEKVSRDSHEPRKELE